MNLCNPIARGNTAMIYLYENKVVKVFNEHLPETEALREANKQQFAYSTGLPVPKVLDITKVDGKQALLMEYVEGKTLGDLYFDDTEKSDDYLKISVEIQRQIHSTSPKRDTIEPMIDKLYRQIEAAPQLHESQKTSVLKKLESMTFHNRLCHGDFHLYNLIKADDKVVIIDWVDSSAGDLRADVYRTYLLYSQFSTDLAERYLQLYCKKSELTRSEILEWAPIIAAARLSENVSSENEDRLMQIIHAYCSAYKLS